MTWLDRLENTVFSITTGDGQVYTPDWRASAETSKEFNNTIFNYIDLPGALVARKEVGPREFPLAFCFQGANNIELSDAFDQSANDKRAWKVVHPYYGAITGQPVKMSRNDSSIGITEITVQLWETITTNGPQATVSVPDRMLALYTALATNSPAEYAYKTNLASKDVTFITGATTGINNDIAKVVDNDDYAQFVTDSATMMAAINQVQADAIAAVSSTFNFYSDVAMFQLSVKARLQLFPSLLQELALLIGSKSTPNDKAFFEAAGAALVGSACIASVNPVSGDYETRQDVLDAATALSGIIVLYGQTLDAAYVSNNDPVNRFSPGIQTQQALQTLLISTQANLQVLAFDAKQVRTTVLTKDSNLILLSHRYVGLDQNDVNLEAFRNLNGIKNRELLQVKRGREIKYLV